MKKKIIQLLKKHKEERIKKQIQHLIQDESFENVNNIKPERVQSIAFVTSYVGAYAGGMTSILRVGTVLSEEGFKITYIALSDQNQNDLDNIAAINLNYYKGKMATKDAVRNKYDIVIATDWKSVYSVTKMEGYKMYFVQDYEPFFCEDGESFVLAKKTYELGLHMISLGKWNKHQIERNEDGETKIDYIDFPYERKEYHMVERNYYEYKNKKQLNLVVYLKQAGRRLPTIIPIMLQKTKENLLDCGVDLHVSFFGGIEGIPSALGTNLGKLSKKELMKLYSEADFGMVSSMSNISLVPYEMLATGLPLIEFKDGTFPYFFEKESAILTSFSAMDLTRNIINCIENPERLVEMNANATECMKNLSWTNSGHQFAEIIRNIG